MSTRLAQISGDGVTWVYGVGPKRLKLSGLVTQPLGLRTHEFPYQPLGNASDFQIVEGQAVADGIRVAAPIIIGANGGTYPTTGWQKLTQPARLAFTFDDSILPPEAYPYVIDPTTTLQPGSAGFDSVILSGSPTSNFGTLDFFRLGDNDAASSTADRSVIEFDVSSIPSGDTVDSTTLSLFEFEAIRNSGAGAVD